MVSNNVPRSGDEITVFLGGPSAGKSIIANAYIRDQIFPSGLNSLDGTGIIKHCAHRVNDGMLIYDTPGISTEEKIPDEIMDIFKHQDVTYKIIFVIAANSGRLSPSAMDIILHFCKTMKVDFEYSVIINKLTNRVINPNYKIYPSDILHLKTEKDATDKDNAMLESGNTIRKFIDAQKFIVI